MRAEAGQISSSLRCFAKGFRHEADVSWEGGGEGAISSVRLHSRIIAPVHFRALSLASDRAGMSCSRGNCVNRVGET